MSDPVLTPRFADALTWATELHAGQTRKGRETPYIAHLLSVSALVLEAGGDEDLAIAALLHDALEDAPSTDEANRRRQEIRSRFGDDVLGVVEGCTDGDPHEKKRLAWIERKISYIRHLEAESDERTLAVSLCDKLHNARAVLRDYRRLGDEVWERFTGKRDGTLSYYHTLHVAYRSRTDDMDPALEAYVEELGRVLDQLPEPREVWELWEEGV